MFKGLGIFTWILIVHDKQLRLKQQHKDNSYSAICFPYHTGGASLSHTTTSLCRTRPSVTQ